MVNVVYDEVITCLVYLVSYMLTERRKERRILIILMLQGTVTPAHHLSSTCSAALITTQVVARSAKAPQSLTAVQPGFNRPDCSDAVVPAKVAF